uniref:Uncharacterized protein n=1 Tax=Corethron hystrix TaxID=216773 RepID=A0A7S1BBP1_9STRA|mmetsp:Transcript_20899/g.47435  ORF Transcript_20899/g.47435 Transcript_20899/m.47435 type:complete len:221 (+) Transcript_20899:191-853(+)
MFGLANGLCSIYFSTPTVTILIVGLDSAGKTTFVEAAKGFYPSRPSVRIPLDRIRPTMGLNITTHEGVGIEGKGCKCVLRDASGQVSMRSHWQKYYGDIDGLIFVVDGTDAERMEEAAVVFDVVRNDDRVTGIPILLFANKGDQMTTGGGAAAPISDIAAVLGLRDTAAALSPSGDDDGIRAMGGSAWDGDGVQDALDWVVEAAKVVKAQQNNGGNKGSR